MRTPSSPTALAALVLLLPLLVLPASAEHTPALTLTNEWRGAYCEALSDKPAADAWGEFPSSPDRPWWTSIRFPSSAPKLPKHPDAFNGLRLETTLAIPADWSGRRIWIELPIPMRRSDAVIFVNTQKAGDILRPGGALDITRFVRPNETNTLSLFLTQDGSGTERGVTILNRWDNSLPRGLMHFPRLYATEDAVITDVFANPSVREKRLTLDIEIDSSRPLSGTLSARIKDPSGTLVKSLSRPLSLPQGITPLSETIPWPDPHFWEFGDGYLYACEVEFRTDTATIAFPSFRFGFREIWREGRHLFMNGHPLHLRTSYSYGAKTRNGLAFLQSVGYNVLAVNHDVNGFPLWPLESLNFSDELGLGMILSCGNPFHIGTHKLHEDKALQKAYTDYLRSFHRLTRNHPSLVACYVSQMIICAAGDFPVDVLGQKVAHGGHHDAIHTARDLNRIHNPNILYYSHGDGPNGDLASGNLYFNWTPPQEMDSWLSQWATKGVYPWHGSEFDFPYIGCWWFGGGYNGTEHLARYYGDRAYDEEPLRALESTLALSASNRNGHGASTPLFDVETDWPLYWDYRGTLVPRINRYWRGYGRNAGVIWFNIAKGYGTCTNELGWLDNGPAPYDIIPDPYDPATPPVWTNQAYRIFQLGNQDFCGYLAGSPEQTDKTHAYYPGETVSKQAAFIWDGAHPKTFSATWSVTLANAKRPFASGSLSRTLTPGQIDFAPFSFIVPKVRRLTHATLTLSYSDGTTDSLALEFLPPPPAIRIPRGTRVALFDPTGEATPILNALSIPFTPIHDPAEFNDATHLIIGRHALEATTLSLSSERLAAGKHVLILPQSPAVWASFGFSVQDAMARDLFLRDRQDPALATLTPAHLHHWRGSPDYGTLYRPIMSHSGTRGPRGDRLHTVAGLVLKVPDRAGYLPLIDGHFDLNYAALLRFQYHRGSITACTLDFEHRVPSDPAATTTAHAVFTSFLNLPPLANSTPITCNASHATTLATSLGFSIAPDSPLHLVGPDSTTPWPTLHDLAASGKTLLIYANPTLTQAAGFKTAPCDFYRAKADPSLPLFRGFTPSLLRWHDALKAQAITAAPPNAKIFADGLFAELPIGRGRALFCQVDPTQIETRFATQPTEETIAADHQFLLSVFRHFLENLGAAPHDSRDGFEPRWPYWNGSGCDMIVQSGVNRSGTNGFIMVLGPSNSGATRRQSTWAFARQFALEGKTVLLVNATKIAEDAGFTLRPQETLPEFDPHTLGITNLGPTRSLAVHLPVHRFLSAPQGFTLSHDGWTASGSVGPGRIHFLQLNPLAFRDTYKDWDRITTATQISSQRSKQLFSRLLLNLGAAPSEEIANRAHTRAGSAAFQPLGAMYVLGPFATQNWTNSDLMNKSGSDGAQAMAISGDFNPNIEFPLPQGGSANWRPVHIPDRDGLLNFAPLAPTNTMHVYYTICPVLRESDGSALLRFGSDFRGRVWCNGSLVLEAVKDVDRPLYQVRIPLHKGENFLAFKIASGHGKGRFWGLLEREKRPHDPPHDPTIANTPLYFDTLLQHDPDSFAYW